MLLTRPGGTVISEHRDGTRITTTPTTVILEHPLYARTIYNTSPACPCRLELASRATVDCLPNGAYDIRHGPGCTVAITGTGAARYSPTDPPSSYTISHGGEDGTILEATDSTGSTFTVSAIGEIDLHVQPASDFKVPLSFLPRVYLLQSDGMGYEIHHKDRYHALLSEARGDAHSMVLEDVLPQCPLCPTATVVTPGNDSAPPRGYLPYLETDIVPRNLRVVIKTERPSTTPPARKRRFGVGMGKGLNVGTHVKTPPKPKYKAPKVLKYRQFVNMGPDTRAALVSSIAKYVEWRDKNENSTDSLLPRVSRELEQEAERLLETALNEKGLSTHEELLGMYQRAWEEGNHLRESSPVSRTSKIDERMDQLCRDTEEAERNKELIRAGSFEPYFESPEGVEFLQKQCLDMDEFTSKLPHTNRKRKSLVSFDLPSQESSLVDATKNISARSTPTTAHLEDHSPGASTSCPSTSSIGGAAAKPRPQNPTPAHANEDGSPTSGARPSNPTPHLAAHKDSPVGHDDSITTLPTLEGPVLEPSAPYPPPKPKSTLYNTMGEMRKTPLIKPSSLSGGRPGEKPNTKV